METTPLLQVRNLKTYFHTPDGVLRAVDDVSFEVRSGETLGIVGESGCGKSVACLSILRLVQTPPGAYEGGEIIFDGNDVLRMNKHQLLELRGGRIAMIFQEPMVALNPVYTIGDQLREAIRLHRPCSRKEANQHALELLQGVCIPNADKVLRSYPFMLSGGMRQRVMIAMALSCKPDLLIADEPTTALDVTIQAQILDLLMRIKAETGLAIIFITHDLGVISETADRTMVMYSGKVCEIADTDDIISNPQHPYTLGLIASKPSGLATEDNRLRVIPGNVPSLHEKLEKPDGCPFHPLSARDAGLQRQISRDDRCCSGAHRGMLAARDRRRGASVSDIILKAIGLKKHFPIRQGLFQRVTGYVRAVDGVDISVERGSVLGIVGESACGKSTLARVLIGLLPPTEGIIEFDGDSILTSTAAAKRKMRRRMNIVFQDPYSSLNPRMTVASLIGEPLTAHRLVKTKRERDCRAAYLLEKCGMSMDQLFRYPHQFSGGQRQRICIARALAAQPELIVCDEAVSALDVSIQSQIINLLMDIRDSNHLTYLFISHNLSVVRFISDQIAVMYLGRIVEFAAKDELFDHPVHPYTKALLSSEPTFDKATRKNRIVLEGDIPSPSAPPSGCRFHTRCREAMARCSEESPETVELSPGHFAACHRYTSACHAVGGTSADTGTVS